MSFMEIILITVAAAIIISAVVFILNKKPIPGISCDEDVIKILRKGDNLNAIKAYRQLHGVGLKEAKRFIDSCDSNVSGEGNGDD